MEPINLREFEAAAAGRLSKMTWDYYAGGAADEITLRENREAWDRFRLRYRVMVDVGQRETSTTVLGQPISFPVLVAPTAMQKLADSDGELATTRATGTRGTIMILSTVATTPVEDVVASATGPVWFQLYVYRDRDATESLVRRAEAAGCTAMMVTVDVPVQGRRERDIRNRFALPEGMTLANVPTGKLHGQSGDPDGSSLAAYIASQFDPALTWKDIDWLRSITQLPLLVKGVVRGDDARRAAECGVSGIVVSNHGGRQLDGAPPTVEVLEEVADAVGDAAEVYIDGGITRGTDVVKALALGARAVLVGRPPLWGLAVGGEQGVNRVLEILHEEFDTAMGLCGCRNVGEVTRDLVCRY